MKGLRHYLSVPGLPRAAATGRSGGNASVGRRAIRVTTAAALAAGLLGQVSAAGLAFAYGPSDNLTVASDSRIKTFIYNPNEVYRVNFQLGYQSYVELAPYEQAQTVSIGNPAAWKVTTADNRVFIKPLEASARTNLTIFTNLRSYQLEIESREAADVPDEKLAFVVRFFQPRENFDVPPVLADRKALMPFDAVRPNLYNFDYSLSGSSSISPVEVYDDGNNTYMRFPGNNAVIPVIFVREATGRVSKAPVRREGAYVVVSGVSNEFQLRVGAELVQVFNEKFSARKW